MISATYMLWYTEFHFRASSTRNEHDFIARAGPYGGRRVGGIRFVRGQGPSCGWAEVEPLQDGREEQEQLLFGQGSADAGPLAQAERGHSLAVNEVPVRVQEPAGVEFFRLVEALGVVVHGVDGRGDDGPFRDGEAPTWMGPLVKWGIPLWARLLDRSASSRKALV